MRAKVIVPGVLALVIAVIVGGAASTGLLMLDNGLRDSAVANSRGWRASSFYRIQSHFVLQQLETSPGTVTVLLGDSHFHGLHAGNVAPNAINAGIGGDRAEWIGARLSAIRAKRPGANIVMMIGINDVLAERSAEEIASDIKALAQSATKGGGTWIMLLLPLTADHASAGDLQPAIHALNAKILSICNEIDTLTVIQTPSDLLDGEALKAEYSEDGLHLNAAGKRILEASLKAALNLPEAASDE